MADSIIKQIKDRRDLVAKLEKKIQDIQARAKNKGVELSREDTDRIAANRADIQVLGEQMEALQKRLEDDKREWEGREADRSETETRFADLAEWEAIDFKGLKSDYDTIAPLAQQEEYRTAITRLDQVMRSLNKPWDEYVKQSTAKIGFESLDGDVEVRLAAANQTKFQTTEVVAALASITANQGIVHGEAKAKDYVKALEALKPTPGALELVEKAIDRATEADREVAAELASLQEQVQNSSYTSFKELEPRIQAASAQADQIPGMITAFEFDMARSSIQRCSAEFDSIKAEEAQLEARKKAEEAARQKLKEQWEARFSAWETARKQTKELVDWGSPEAASLEGAVKAVEAHESAEEWAEATSALSGLEAAIRAPYGVYLHQREAMSGYEAGRPDLDSRAGTAKGNQHADAAVKKDLSGVDNSLTGMDALAKARDYVEASARLVPTGNQLDKVEQQLRELEIRAELGDVSSEEVEREVQRRLYEKEYPIAGKRVDAAKMADLLPAEPAKRLDAIAESLAGARGQADEGNHAEAVKTLRKIIDDMGPIDEEVRAQELAQTCYEKSLRAVQLATQPLADSRYKKVNEAAQKLSAAWKGAADLADSKDFKGAFSALNDNYSDLDAATDLQNRMAEDEIRLDTAMATLLPRIKEAEDNDVDELAQARKAVTEASGAIEDLVTDQDFEGALARIEPLESLLDDFEKEVRLHEDKLLYEASLMTLKIEDRLAATADKPYPEAGAEITEVDSQERARQQAVQTPDYALAREKAFALDKALNAFEDQCSRIDQARDQVEHSDPALKEAVAKATQPAPEKSSELVNAQMELQQALDALAKAVGALMYIEALKHSEDALIKAEAAIQIIFDMTEINHAVTMENLTKYAKDLSKAHGSGYNLALVHYRIDLQNAITRDRDFQKHNKNINYGIDIILALADSVADPISKGVLNVSKVVVNIMIDNADDELDDRAEATAAKMVDQLAAVSGEVEGAFNYGFADRLKSGETALYEKIGRHYTREEFSEARTALYSAGYRDQTVTEAMNGYLKQLRSVRF